MKDKENIHETKETALSDEDRSLLASLSGVKEIVKVGHGYPDLRSQAIYAMQDSSRLMEEIIREIRDMMDESGDYIADVLIESIYHEFVTTFEPSEAGSDDFDFTHKALDKFANDTFAKIEAAKHIREICRKYRMIKDSRFRIVLAKKGVLL